MTVFRYLSHPQVQIDPAVPVPQWGLSDVGRARTRAIANAKSLQLTTQIISSAETKAVETASIISSAMSVPITIVEATHENDRSATGYLKGEAFEHAADQFFAHPQQSYLGWERAVDAQARILRETQSILESWQAGDILMVGHGGVGTLLYCHFARLPINRMADQLPGGGNYWSMTIHECQILLGWQPMEQL